jgi:isochorismate synthase/2-succinyl-5-enolpyruvyl-6-hydroxy-3-cyclohexene-1-carboxylate synthase/2-succinyl-6-hydroxy-2,4-cyclohexadiene-1-carboxylate synthase/O-succinylbenzoate synthase
MIACTLAWDAASMPSDNENMNSASTYKTLKAATAAAITALHSTRPPSLPHAPAPRLTQLSMQHLPSEKEWAARLDAVHAELVPATSSSSRADVTDVTFGTTSDNYNGTSNTDIGSDSLNYLSTTTTTHPPQKLSPDVALEEYLRNGQQGLDELLAALDSGFEAILSPSGSSGDDEFFTEEVIENADTAFLSSSSFTTTADNKNGNDGASKKNTPSKSTNGNGKSHKHINKGMNKIVLARRTNLDVAGHLDPLTLLEALQERDPRAYQIFLQLPSRTTFLASTPECLYTRSGSHVASEAVAGTRARGPGGDVEKDFWLAFDLLRSQKDDVEFGVVRDWVRRALGTVCDDVRVEIQKSVLKQGSVQHLYGKLAGTLKEDIGDAALLAALHPTPAVCGQPRGDALKMLSEVETFDRGLYSGPFGWVGKDAAEFVVAIRSALIRPRVSPGTALLSAYDVALFAGVGIVCGSDTASEWAELNLKISQFERLLKPAPSFSSAPNISALWARVMVEELCRRGCNTFCVAPGSRSSPLTVAIASHPRAKIVSCIDERSLGFWALGYGRARGLPAVVVTSSGTAVANLLPAVVEATQSHIPMLLLTADRPFELRETGANQTIDQVNIFGNYTRWDCDLEAPLESTPVIHAVEKVGEAVRAACATPAVPAGPVHLNCQFREPLAPTEEIFENCTCLEGLHDWETSQKPLQKLSIFNDYSGISGPNTLTGANGPLFQGNDEMAALLSTAGKARRGLLIIGELIQPEDVAAIVQLAQSLGWPIAADVLSGIKIGAPPLHEAPLKLISHFDHLLLDSSHWKVLKPDVVLQVGGHVTSKRVAQFLEWCCCEDTVSTAGTQSATTSWLFVSRAPLRQDQGPGVKLRVKASVSELLSAFQQQEDLLRKTLTGTASTEQTAYCQLLQTLDSEASLAIDDALSQFVELTEPAVARLLSQELPPGEGLFIGNSMPIRDLDMYGMPAVREMPVEVNHQSSTTTSTTSSNITTVLLNQWSPQGVVQAGVGAPVAANRGASGIDGVLSTAAGFADGLQRGTTLVVGDISFLHDVNGLNLLRSGKYPYIWFFLSFFSIFELKKQKKNFFFVLDAFFLSFTRCLFL